MSFAIQLSIAVVIVAVAAGVLVRRAWRALRGHSRGCGTTCGGCSDKPLVTLELSGNSKTAQHETSQRQA